MENSKPNENQLAIQTSWMIPFVAAVLVVLTFFQSGSHSFSNFIDQLFFWMLAACFFTPLKYIKRNEAGDGLILEKLKAFPLESVTLLFLVSWVFMQNNRWSVRHNGLSFQLLIFLFLLFVSLTTLGYLVTYIKDTQQAGSAGWKKHSLLYDYFTIRLDQGQSFRIFILVFGQVPVALIITYLSYLIDPWNQLTLITLLVASYLLFVFLYIRKKVNKVQKDYSKLLKMTQDIKNGTLDEKVTESFGLFNPLKEELSNIQDGLSHAVEHRISSERMKSELITNVSHDLKTPLTAIITYVDLLQDDNLEEEKRKLYLDTLDAKTERLKALIEDLFEVSKASTGNIQMELQEVDVTILMKQTLLGLEDVLAKSDLVIRENYPDEPVTLNLDGDRTHRVFENLIINMAKYAMPGTRAYIDVTTSPYQTDIILRNISAHELKDQLEDLSERFVRGDESRSTEGSGLGLAIAKSFVELQGGTFSIKTDGDLFKVIISFNS